MGMSSGPFPAGRAGSPKLLVSVRSVAEARAAMAGGADIIDVKEPRRGSLGMADLEVVAAITEFVRSVSTTIPISAALGELTDAHAQDGFRLLPDGLTFAKLGLAGAARSADWLASWEAVRRSVVGPADWVAVAYADWQSVAAPPPVNVIAAALDTGCAGVLIDTCRKDSGRLVELVSREQLTEWVNRVHQAGRFIALAGRIAYADLERLAEVPADVIAVRSAVCLAQVRNADVSSELVASIRERLQQVCPAT